MRGRMLRLLSPMPMMLTRGRRGGGERGGHEEEREDAQRCSTTMLSMEDPRAGCMSQQKHRHMLLSHLTVFRKCGYILYIYIFTDIYRYISRIHNIFI